jgi:hypothetical protein
MLEKAEYIREHELDFDERTGLCSTCNLSECLYYYGDCPNGVGDDL